MLNDSTLFARQQYLWEKQIGSKLELEQRDLAYQNSKNTYYSSRLKYNDLKRLLNYNSSQAQKNLLISRRLEKDYTLRSEIDGIVYNFDKSRGEIVNPQTPIAIIGDANKFILEMQVDEYDIIRIKKGQLVLLSFDSYKGKVFEGTVTKLDPIMNEHSKTFKVEAEFIKAPKVLYPKLSFEANIVIQTREKALLIPRSFIINDSIVIKKNGKKIKVKTGLRDYQKIEILSGINESDELIKPEG
jgi:multidrug efflux pump subunit AcrA (membrane-fusion protein)